MILFFRKSGSGPPLFILHGLYGSSDNWVTIAKSLSARFTVYLPDLRNHGQSFHSEQHDYQSMANDLYLLVTSSGIKKFFLAGHSMGGKTAMFFALQWPEMIEGLLIADISPFTNDLQFKESSELHKSILEAILSVNPSLLTSRKEAELLLSEKIHSEKIRGFILKNLERTLSGSFKWRLNASSLLNNLNVIMEGLPVTIHKLSPVSGFPVIFLKAANSSYIEEADIIDINRLFPAAEIRTIENSGHWIHTDRPDEVREALLSLLS